MSEPRVYWNSKFNMDDSESGAKEWTPKAEWSDLRCYVEKATYDKLAEENARLKAELATMRGFGFEHAQLEIQHAKFEIERHKADRERLMAALEHYKAVTIGVQDERKRLQAELEQMRDERDQALQDEAEIGKLKDEVQHMQMTDSHMAQYNIKATAKIEELELLAESYRAKLASIAEWQDCAIDLKAAHEMRDEARQALEE